MSSALAYREPTKDHPFWTIIATQAGSPFTVTLEYAAWTNEDGSKRTFGLANVSVAQADPGEAPTEDFKNITTATMRDLADNWDGLDNAARAYLAVLTKGTVTTQDLFSVSPRTRRVLSDSFLADMVRRHADYRTQGIGANKALAREERVSVSTVKHWLATARKRGIGEAS